MSHCLRGSLSNSNPPTRNLLYVGISARKVALDIRNPATDESCTSHEPSASEMSYMSVYYQHRVGTNTLQETQTWTAKGFPQISFQAVTSVCPGMVAPEVSLPGAPPKLWTVTLSIINREQDVHMSTFGRFSVKTPNLSPKMAVDTPRGVSTPRFGTGCPSQMALKTFQSQQTARDIVFFVVAVLIM